MSYTRQIPPGGEGKITIKVNTRGFGGSKLRKNIKVFTNDVKQPMLSLTVAGFVEKFATITPTRLILRGRMDKPLKGMVKIIPEKKYPFKILGLKAKTGKDISYQIDDYEEGEEKGFLLTVNNLKKDKGRYFDVITVQTDSPLYPEIVIGVHGSIEAE